MTRENAIDEVENTINMTIEQYGENIEDLYNLSYSLIAVPSIRSWVSNQINWGDNDLEDIRFIEQLKSETNSNLMFNYTWKSKIVNSIELFKDDYNTILAQRLAESIDSLQFRLSQIYNLTAHIKDANFFFRRGNEIFYIQRVYNNTNDDSLTYIYEINTDVFLDMLDNLSTEIDLNIFFYGSELYTQKADTEKENFAINFLNKIYPNEGLSINRELKNTPLKFEILVPDSYLNKPIVSTMATMLLVFLMILIVVPTLVALLSSSTTRFMVRLVEGINEIKTHKMGHTLERSKDKDLNEIVDAFNSMSLELQQLIDKGYKSDVLLLQSNIRQLQSQINPHFLINSLASISTNALLNGDEKTYEMLTALSTVLDQSMYNTKDYSPFIQLKDEMVYVDCYLKIQKFRFEDKLQIVSNIDESLYSLFVPRFSIVPLVENAVIHGVQDRIEQGVISIDIKVENKDLYAIIRDNGKSLERYNSIEKNNSTSHHIAVKNTNNRIHLLFGKEYGITYNFELENITEVVLHLPIVDSNSKPLEELY
jgi:two-component system sensor histidine kinase YesM